MKKLLALLTMLSLILCVFCACSQNDSEGSATLVIVGEESTVYTVPLSELSEGKGLMPAFEYLKETKGLEYEVSGSMIGKIGELENDYDLGKYIFIFTSVEADFDVSELKREVEYEGKTLVSTGVGFDQMTLTSGAIIYIGLVSY